jgi:hypothetical protein
MLDYVDNIDAPYAYVESGEAIRDAQRLLVEPGSYAYLLTNVDRVMSTGKGISILQLRGLGRDVWAGVSADTYIRALRNEWPSGD